MKIIQLQNDQIHFQFPLLADPNHCLSCIKDITSNGISTGNCSQNNYYYLTKKDTDKTLVCFSEQKHKTSKKAKFLAKLTLDFIQLANRVNLFDNEIYTKAENVALHNTRNLNAQINSKILNFLNEEELAKSINKISYIREKINNNSYDVAREILSILKLTSDILFEYNAMDYLSPDAKLNKSDYTFQKIHTLIVLSFYTFEEEFRKKNIMVNIQNSNSTFRLNFNTMKSALSQLFDNSLKYCAPNSTLLIEIKELSDSIRIIFEMKSLYLNDLDLQNIFLLNYRSDAAKTENISGSGIGMYVSKKLIELNNGAILCKRLREEKVDKDFKKYSINQFSITLNKQKTFA